MARRPNTGGITQIGEFMVNNSLPMAPPPPIRRLPPPSIRELPPTRGRSGGNDGYIIGPTDQVYNYSDLPKLKEQVAQNPMMARMLGDIISRLEAKDFDGTGDPLGDRGVGRRPPSIEQKRPPSIEEQVAQVLSGPNFPGRQMPKFPGQQPMRTPEPVGPSTDMRTMPSMPVAPVPSPMSVPPIAIEDPDTQKVVDALPKGTRQPVQPPVIPPTMTMPPIMETPPQTEVKLPDGTVIDLSDLMPQPEEERIPVDPTDPNDPMYGIFPGAEPKDLLPPDLIEDMESRDILGGLPTPEDLSLKNKYPLPEGVDPGGRYFIDPITGDPMYAPPMPTLAPGMLGVQVMPTSINLMTGKPRDTSLIPSEPTVPAPEVIPPAPPVSPSVPETETTPEPMMPPAPETTPVQGMTMEQMQKMIADMQAQQQEQAAARAAQEKEMAQNYMVPGSRMGYNPYQSGQYQSDPYGPSGVPNMGGITTIPVPDGYGIYNPVYGG